MRNSAEVSKEILTVISRRLKAHRPLRYCFVRPARVCTKEGMQVVFGSTSVTRSCIAISRERYRPRSGSNRECCQARRARDLTLQPSGH